MKAILARAGLEDAAAILDLQVLCFQSEARLCNDFTIPPLVQTLDELKAQFATHVFLVARCDGEIIGSVRGVNANGTCQIGRLIVHPVFQRQGLGTRLLAAIEAHFAGQVKRYELFTGAQSENNLQLYTNNGYREFQRKRVPPGPELVYLEKPAGAAVAATAR